MLRSGSAMRRLFGEDALLPRALRTSPEIERGWLLALALLGLVLLATWPPETASAQLARGGGPETLTALCMALGLALGARGLHEGVLLPFGSAVSGEARARLRTAAREHRYAVRNEADAPRAGSRPTRSPASRGVAGFACVQTVRFALALALAAPLLVVAAHVVEAPPHALGLSLVAAWAFTLGSAGVGAVVARFTRAEQDIALFAARSLFLALAVAPAVFAAPLSHARLTHALFAGEADTARVALFCAVWLAVAIASALVRARSMGDAEP